MNCLTSLRSAKHKILLMKTSISPGSTKNPFTPSLNISGIAPTGVVIIGSPALIASSITIGKFSL